MSALQELIAASASVGSACQNLGRAGVPQSVLNDAQKLLRKIERLIKEQA